MAERERLIAIIEAENKKPIEQRNIDLIDECLEKFIGLNPEEDLTDEELEQGLEKLREKFKEEELSSKKPKIKRINFRHLLVAAIILISVGVTAIITTGGDSFAKSMNLKLKENKDTFDDLDYGETMVVDGHTIIKTRRYPEYKSFEDFEKDWSHLELLYPVDLPDGITCRLIDIGDAFTRDYKYLEGEYDILFVLCCEGSYRISAHTEDEYDGSFIEASPIVRSIAGHECYISAFENEITVCNFVHNGTLYYIHAPTVEDIIEIVEGMKPLG